MKGRIWDILMGMWSKLVLAYGQKFCLVAFIIVFMALFAVSIERFEYFGLRNYIIFEDYPAFYTAATLYRDSVKRSHLYEFKAQYAEQKKIIPEIKNIHFLNP